MSPRASNFYDGVHQFTVSQREVAADVFGDCLLPLGQNEQLLVNNETWIISDGTWTKLSNNFHWESTDSRRTFQFGICGLVYDTDGTPLKAVVGGGQYGESFSQIFDIATRSWRTGPKLPGALFQNVNVQAGRSFLVVGGLTRIDGGSYPRLDTIIEFNPDSEQWELRPERLSTVRHDMYATMVNEDIIPC